MCCGLPCLQKNISKEEQQGIANAAVFELRSQEVATAHGILPLPDGVPHVCPEDHDFVCVKAPKDRAMHCVIVLEPENSQDKNP
jgi:hypothetical protein